MRKLLVSKSVFNKDGYDIASFDSFGKFSLSNIEDYNLVVFDLLSSFSEKDLTRINCTAALISSVTVVCEDVDKFIQSFHRLNINKSKEKIDFSPKIP